MRIKTILTASFIICITVFSLQAKAIAPSYKATVINTGNNKNDSMQIVKMQQRVNDIQNMDVQNMSSGQKKSLRIELKQMLKQAKNYNDGGGSSSGIYLSVGGLIIIILLLILILR
jgi:hypothetical protein